MVFILQHLSLLYAARSKIHGLSFSLAHEEPGVLRCVASLAGHLGLPALSDMAQDLLEGGERRR